MNAIIQTPYGAYELKQAYQKNMLMGTASMIVFTALVVFGVWLYSTLTYVDDINKDPIGIEIPISMIPPPSLERVPRPQISVAKPDIPEVRAVVGIPVPVPDDELADDDEQTLYTREQLKNIYAPTFENSEGDGGGNLVIDVKEPELDPEVFVPHEKEPEVIYQATPVYPRLAEGAGFTANVWVQVLVNNKGRVVKAQVAKCSRPGLGFEEEAIRAAKKCTYRPAIQNGNPVPCWISYKIKFIQE